MSIALLSFFIAAGAPTSIFPLYERAWGFEPSMLTLAFGIYAVSLIVVLPVVGSLSDYVGRRPLMVAALALELLAMLTFLVAPSIGWLIVGRVLQGIATGVASSTFGAAVVELAPERYKKLGTAMTSLATTAGLGVGALAASIVAVILPASASTVVWTVLVATMIAGTLFAIATPETSTRRRGALASLIPRMSVPLRARALFTTTVPTLVAIFMVTGLFQGLLPLLLRDVFAVTDPVSSGAINFVVFTLAAAAAGVTGAMRPHFLRSAGTVLLGVSALLMLASFATESVLFVWVAAALGGIGAGSALSGSTRGLVPQVEPHQRAALFSAFFFVAYVTLSIAIIGGGQLAKVTSSERMAVIYVIILATAALCGILLSVIARRGNRREATTI